MAATVCSSRHGTRLRTYTQISQCLEPMLLTRYGNCNPTASRGRMNSVLVGFSATFVCFLGLARRRAPIRALSHFPLSSQTLFRVHSGLYEGRRLQTSEIRGGIMPLRRATTCRQKHERH
jgi:hypothetical protein